MMRKVEVSIPATEEADSVDARVTPTGSLENLSQMEVDRLLDSSRGGLYPLYRRCSLAVLNSGGETDDARAIFDRYADFDIDIVRQAWGIKLELHNAPAAAFVDGRMIRGIQEHLFAVLRDILYIHGEVYEHGSIELRESAGITNAVYRVLRNAGLLQPRVRPDIVVCWGGHSIGRDEYDYTKLVGYELGLRGLNVCTGCGPGAMKGPMKGATIGHAKQRIPSGRYEGAYWYKIRGRAACTKTSFTVNAAAITSLHSAGIYEPREYAAALADVADGYAEVSRDWPSHFYYWYGNYYAAQALFTEGGPRWRAYWRELCADLLARQRDDGRWINDVGPGDAFATAIACLLLRLPAQYLPIFRR